MAVFLVKTFGLQLYGPTAPRVGPTNPYRVGVTLIVEGHLEHYEFRPSTIHIHVGDTIIWALDGIHSSTGPDWDSGVGPSSFAHTFTEAGTFDYHCTAGNFRQPPPTTTRASSSSTRRHRSTRRNYEHAQ